MNGREYREFRKKIDPPEAPVRKVMFQVSTRHGNIVARGEFEYPADTPNATIQNEFEKWKEEVFDDIEASWYEAQ
ncbi:hypothetical protein ABES02_29280 [Neobacillus pocheonensis]|uniref:hypothetical protein n=1 Tax=Neobacillus pocheonensis TaxID=363869 RepID=UPI003D27DB65